MGPGGGSDPKHTRPWGSVGPLCERSSGRRRPWRRPGAASRGTRGGGRAPPAGAGHPAGVPGIRGHTNAPTGRGWKLYGRPAKKNPREACNPSKRMQGSHLFYAVLRQNVVDVCGPDLYSPGFAITRHFQFIFMFACWCFFSRFVEHLPLLGQHFIRLFWPFLWRTMLNPWSLVTHENLGITGKSSITSDGCQVFHQTTVSILWLEPDFGVDFPRPSFVFARAWEQIQKAGSGKKKTHSHVYVSVKKKRSGFGP